MADVKCVNCGRFVVLGRVRWATPLCYLCLPPRPPNPPPNPPPPPPYAAKDEEIARLKAELDARDAEIAKRKKAARKVAAWVRPNEKCLEEHIRIGERLREEIKALKGQINDLSQNYNDLNEAYDAMQVEIAKDRHGRSLPLTMMQKQLLEEDDG